MFPIVSDIKIHNNPSAQRVTGKENTMSKNMLLLTMVGSGLLLFGCGETPLHKAAEQGDIEAVKKLIADGADINSQNGRDGETPLHRAITRGQTEMAKLLIDSGANVNIGRKRDGQTPLAMAVSRGRDEIAKLLRAKGAK